jgi:hypothetical protein
MHRTYSVIGDMQILERKVKDKYDNLLVPKYHAASL